MFSSALKETDKIYCSQEVAQKGQPNPKEGDGEEIDDEDDEPEHEWDEKRNPEDSHVDVIGLSIWVPGFEDPLLIAVFSHLAPPA